MSGETFDLAEFGRQMTELAALAQRSDEILRDMLRRLGVDVEEEAAKQAEQKRAAASGRRSRRGSAAQQQREAQMAAVRERTVSAEAQAFLRRCIVDDDAISFPPGERLGEKVIDRALYNEVNDVLVALGGKWNRRRVAHVFDDLRGADLAERFYAVAESGLWTRPQDHGYYPTPDWLVNQMVSVANVRPRDTVLEPSAGRGSIVAALLRHVREHTQITAVELLPENCEAVWTRTGVPCRQADFLAVDFAQPFDRVVMNPPFGSGAAVRHVERAISFLKPGGRLVAILPASITFRQDVPHRTLRQRIVLHGSITPLPEGVFRDAGTDVRTVLVVYDHPKDAALQPRSEPPAAVSVVDESTAAVRRLKRPEMRRLRRG